MSPRKTPPPRPRRLADRLALRRGRGFVGRQAELELFRAALQEAEPSFAVLHVYGPGGVGKSTLLREYERLAQELDVPAVLLDGRSLNPAPADLARALRLALGLEAEDGPPEALAPLAPRVLLLDTYEALAPLDAWLRERFLPRLPEHSLVVTAGRDPPDAAWRTDPAWRELARSVSLRNLRPEESRAFLAAQGVPEARHPDVLAFTHGHPLALSLVAGVLAQPGAPAEFQPERSPDVIQALVARFVQQAPGPAHRQALEACAHVRFTTESLLRAALEREDVYDIFAWLRGLSFVEAGPRGLAPHDLAREALDADQRWRDPQAYARLHRRVKRYYYRELETARGLEQQQAAFDLAFLHRHSLLKPYFEWKEFGRLYEEPARPEDHPAILAMVEKHEGPDSARLARHWLGRRPQDFVVICDAGRAVQGFAAHLLLAEPAPEDLAADPAVRRAWEHVRQRAPLRPGEVIEYYRFGMDREAYNAVSPAISLLMARAVWRWTTIPGLAWSFIPETDPEFWQPVHDFVDFQRAPEADFEVGGRRFYLFVHDWRAAPPAAWLDLLDERELAREPVTPAALPAPPPPPVLVLSQPEFEAAVRQALRDFADPAVLRANPLLRSRLAAAESSGPPRPEALQALLREAALALRASPKGEKYYRAVAATYLQPAPSQELAAERLDLPFGTYRHHLAAGVQRIADWLWQRELYGSVS